MISKSFDIKFLDSGREPECPPDPAYPDGIDLHVNRFARPRCTVELPYPAPRCGAWMVRCSRCGYSVAVTTAGRVDDPRSVTLPCRGD